MSKYLSVLDIFWKRSQNKVPEWYWKHIMQLFSHLPHRIFLIFCIPLDHYTIWGTFWPETHVEIIFRSRYIKENGPTSGSETGPKICSAVFFNFSDCQQPVRALHWVHLCRICISNALSVLDILVKTCQKLTFLDIS